MAAMPVPDRPKIYHIVHIDRLPSIAAEGWLWCDAVVVQQPRSGTTIGMQDLKARRLTLPLASRPGLMVGGCVPFYFCPRSIMLYLLHMGNHPNLQYRGGQRPIVHLEADLLDTVEWAEQCGMRWAFTLSNAASRYFSDRCSLSQLVEINWEAVGAHQWSAQPIREGKQAEFLLERCYPWRLVSRIGVHSREMVHPVSLAMQEAEYRPVIEVRRDWYY